MIKWLAKWISQKLLHIQTRSLIKCNLTTLSLWLALRNLRWQIFLIQVKNSDEDHAEQFDEDKVDWDDDPNYLLAKVRCKKTGGAKLIEIELTSAIDAHEAHNNNGEEIGQCANSPE